MLFIYVLRSLKNGRLYTGSTSDIQKRFAEHNAGVNKATRFTRPFELLHTESFATRAEAVQRERFLKTGLGRQELKKILGFHRGLVGR
jgi:putative endonuclease